MSWLCPAVSARAAPGPGLQKCVLLSIPYTCTDKLPAAAEDTAHSQEAPSQTREGHT